jgi:hypothetical protein
MAGPGEAKEVAGIRLSPAVEAAAAVGISIALLIPIFWLDHIEAGDLSSHVYNAWLAGQIERGTVTGLFITHPFTNVLTDLLLKFFLTLFGPAAAERIVTGAAVLIFFWGAFYLSSVVAQRRAWIFAPGFAMIAYGLVFQFGFLNFYLSTGLCCWTIGLLWNVNGKRMAAAALTGALAFVAHPMPVAWAAGVLGYVHLARYLSSRARPALLLAGLAVVAGGCIFLMGAMPSRWSPTSVSVLTLTGADQVRLFDVKYLLLAFVLLAIWAVMFLERLDMGGMFNDPLVHLWILQVTASALMPSAIQLPQYKHVLAYIPERLSLFNAVIFCVMVGRARYGRGLTRVTAAVATLFFTFLYIDVRAYNEVEQQIAALASQAPEGARFVAEISDSNSRLSPLMHAADWACIGHCFSYANYEPATGQFRIQVDRPNSFAAFDMRTVQEIEDGRHIVAAEEAPVYAVCRCEEQKPPFCLRRLQAGEKTCSFSLPITWGTTLPFAWRVSGIKSAQNSRSRAQRTSN